MTFLSFLDDDDSYLLHQFLALTALDSIGAVDRLCICFQLFNSVKPFSCFVIFVMKDYRYFFASMGVIIFLSVVLLGISFV